MQSTIKTICCICLLIIGLQPALGFKFQKASFIQLIPTDIEVEVGTSRYDLELTYTSPCTIYLTSDLEQKYMIGKHNQIKMIREKCSEHYINIWEARMEELLKTKPVDRNSFETNNPRGLIRKKRFIPLLFAVGIIMAISACTNLMWAGMSEVLPWGDGYRLRSQQTQIDLEQERISNLEKMVQKNTETLKVINKELERVEK